MGTLEEAILAAAQTECIVDCTNAPLERAIILAGYLMASQPFVVCYAGQNYLCQVGEKLTGREAAVFYSLVTDGVIHRVIVPDAKRAEE